MLKAVISLLLLALEYRRLAQRKKEDARHVGWSEAVFTPLKTALSTRWPDLAVLLIPSILYAGQNNLLVSGPRIAVSKAALKLTRSLTFPCKRSMWPSVIFQLLSIRSHIS